MPASEDAALTLAYDDAVVPFFQRWIDDEGGENLRAHVRNDAELWALNINTVSCALEPSIAPLDQNYPNAVQKERRCGSSRR
jgi:hypothetical protein